MITLFTKAFQQKVFHHLYVFIIGKLSCVTQRRKTFLSFNKSLKPFHKHRTPTCLASVPRVSEAFFRIYPECPNQKR